MNLTELFCHLQAGDPVIAVNRRLARYLVALYDQQMLANGANVWPRPVVMSYEPWLQSCLQATGNRLGLLSPLQAQTVWEGIVKQATRAAGTPLLQVRQSAKMALAARQQLVRYQVDFSNSEASADQRAFLGWLAAWDALAADNGWCDASDLPRLLIAAITAGSLELPKRIVFAGFDNLSPVDTELQRALQQAGCNVGSWQPTPLDAATGVFAAKGLEDEVRSCGRWVRRLLKEKPGCRLAVVAPQLEQYRPLLESVFLAEVDPFVIQSGEPYSEVVNVSLGQRLDRLPVIRAVLNLLATGAQIDYAALSWLLRSPYLAGSVAEQHARALADRSLREKKLPRWSLARLIRALEPLKVPQFRAVLESSRQRPPRSQRCKPGSWAEHFLAEIEQTGWPGERPLSSHDYQAVDKFYQVLESLAALDRVTEPVSRQEALQLFSRMVADTIFQPETREGGVEVLGLLEAVGQSFEHLWVLGLHDAALPQPAQPNPFIPLPLQRRLEMPHADAERELGFAKTVAQRLFAAAHEVVLSWPRTIDGSPCRPSPLLKPFAPVEPELAPSSDPACAIRDQRPELEPLADHRVAPIYSAKPIAGGTGILKDQAICPFRAFAHHRLRAEGMDVPDIGLDGMNRGTLIHAVLEQFWQQVVTQRRLLELGDDELQNQLQQAIEQALNRFERQQRVDLSPRQRRLETLRLERLSRKWLDVDRNRPEFSARVEERHTETIGRLQLRTRIDRIDELANGQVAIVDFKSGRVDPKQWLEERLTEPQLPIYTLSLPPERIAAVLFAQLRGNDEPCRFAGLAREPDDWPGLSSARMETLLADKSLDDFDAVLKLWRSALNDLAAAFVDGAIEVAPVGSDSCEYCDIRPLCRIDDPQTVGAEVTDG